MKTAKIFKTGRSQAVRLPKEYRFEEDEVYIKKFGGAVILFSRENSWDSLFSSLDEFSEDFMSDRIQPPLENRSEMTG